MDEAGKLRTFKEADLAVLQKRMRLTDRHHGYALRLAEMFGERGVRCRADLNDDRMQAKIRQAQMMKVPYMLIVGDQEMQAETVAVRRRDGVRLDNVVTATFLANVKEKIRSRTADL